MNSSQRYYLLLLVTLTAYFVASKYIFDKVYYTIKTVINEFFHIPQGQAFCEGNYTQWDPKNTPLPGLYLVSSTALGFYFECDTYNLRFVNLIASCINLILFAAVLRFIHFIERKQVKNVIQALNLTLLPPLYFFSHVYYTDSLSITFLLIFSRLCFTSKYKITILVFGFFSVLMRQTNIAWIAMIFSHKVLNKLLISSRVFGNKYIFILNLGTNSSIAQVVDNSKLKRYYNVSDVYLALKYHTGTQFVTFYKLLSLHDRLVLITHSILLVSFPTFVFLNGGETAHKATIHLAQLLYFLIFYGVFGLPYVIVKLPSTLRLINNNKLRVILLSLIMIAIVHFNTVINPCLLADNRHFTFYMWSRWYGKYDFAIYATIPVYMFLLFSLYDNLKDQNCISFLLPYCLSLFLALGLENLIDMRYYLIPYIILRLHFVRPPMFLVVFEFLYYSAINVAVFYVFIHNEVHWHDFGEVQRIIW